MPETVERIRRAYAPDQALPLGAYAGIVATFNLAALGLGLFAAKRKRVPSRIGWDDLLLLGIATYRLSRLISKDWVTMPLRAPFTRHLGVGPAPNEAEEEARGQGLQRTIGELLICPYCVNTWVAAGLTGSFLLSPPVTRLYSSILAVETLSDGLSMAHQAAWQILNPEP